MVAEKQVVVSLVSGGQVLTVAVNLKLSFGQHATNVQR